MTKVATLPEVAAVIYVSVRLALEELIHMIGCVKPALTEINDYVLQALAM